MSFDYPTPRRDESAVDDFHGNKIPDPYKWMEDPYSQETKDFVEKQNQVSGPYINSCVDKDKIKKDLTDFWNYEKIGCPHKEGNKYFFSRNSGLQNQSVIYVQDTLEAEPRVLFDPNTLAEDGTISLGHCAWSHDGLVFSYSLSTSGSDWQVIKFRNVETGEDYPETLENVKFSNITWTKDNKGIFYGCYPDHDPKNAKGTDTESLKNQKLYYHLLGTNQSEDVLCVEFPENPKYLIGWVDLSECGRYLFVKPSQDCKYNLLYFYDLEKNSKEGIKNKFDLVPIVEKFEADIDFVTNIGQKCVFHTNKGAEKFKLVTIDMENPAETKWTDLVPETEDKLEWACGVAGDKLITCYMHHVKNTLQLRDLTSGDVTYSFPLDVGAITGFSGELKHKEMFYKFSSPITPGTMFHVDLTESSPKSKVHIETKLSGFDSSKFRVEQVFYPSKDGTKIPMFVTMRKDFVADGSSPCLLYGYGGFSISQTPCFNTVFAFWIQHFGIMAVANIRGGGEYGESWSNAGRLNNLQNCLTDFQMAGEWLVENKYTSRDRLTIKGGSHGGMLVGACVNQRPDLFGAGVASVGVMDLLRFQKFTVGYAWVSNYGSSDIADQFDNLRKISPLHNIDVPPTCQYPAVLLVTADHDDRVVPSHSLKHIATLQHTLGQTGKQTNPLMIMVETKAGHGGGKPTSKTIDEYTDVFCFLIKALGIKYVSS